MFESFKITEVVTAIAAAIIAGIFGIQRLMKGWKETSTESSVISMMHEELERMSAHNKVLATELSSLQVEILNLNKELRNLTVENQKLHQEVVSLTAEVARLQQLLRKNNMLDE